MDNLPKLRRPSKALATVEPLLIYTEAKRQYNALKRASNDSETNKLTISIRDLNYSLWSDATIGLKPSWAKHLETICFAYKTKLNVMRYLEIMEDSYPWARFLLDFVQERGRDSAFNLSADTGEFEECSELRVFIQHRQQQHGTDVRASPIDQARSASDKLRAKPIFIISTLPFAAPTAFFSCLAGHGPLDALANVDKLLTYPAALLLHVDGHLRTAIRNAIPAFWQPDQEKQNGPAYEEEKKEWGALFDHLSRETFCLAYKNGQIRMFDDEHGYGYTDLSLWGAVWQAERGKPGFSENGRQLRESNFGRKRERESSDTSQENEDGGVMGSRKKAKWVVT